MWKKNKGLRRDKFTTDFRGQFPLFWIFHSDIPWEKKQRNCDNHWLIRDKPLEAWFAIDEVIIDFRGVVQKGIQKKLSKLMNFFPLTYYFSNPQMKTPNVIVFSDFRHYFLIHDRELENISTWDSYFLLIRKRLSSKEKKKKSYLQLLKMKTKQEKNCYYWWRRWRRRQWVLWNYHKFFFFGNICLIQMKR